MLPKLTLTLKNCWKKNAIQKQYVEYLEIFFPRAYGSKQTIHKPKNKSSRLAFAKDHADKDDSFCNTVIFADESKYNLFGSDGKSYVWRKPNTEVEPKNLKSTVKHGGGSVIVWACMSSAGVGNLVFIETTMDNKAYLKILQNNLLESAPKLGIRDNFRFYQDNDPKHKSNLKPDLAYMELPHIVQTPAQSPDHNEIENLWHILEINIRKHEITSEKTLKIASKTEWEKIYPESWLHRWSPD